MRPSICWCSQPSQSEIAVDETLILDNPSKTTYSNDAQGSMRFFLPPPANGQVRVSATGPEGMPLPQAPRRLRNQNIYQVNFPLKPGQTQFQLTYVLPVGSPFTFRRRGGQRKRHAHVALRLVAPDGVSLSGSAIQRVGQEPNTRATIYNVVANGNFSVDITGTGALPGQQNENAAASPTTADNSDEPPVTEGAPKFISISRGWLRLRSAFWRSASSRCSAVRHAFPNRASMPASEGPMSDAIAIEKLWKFYGDYPALRDTSLHISEGSCSALLGRNGAGKTTLLRILAGLSPFQRGAVHLAGESPRSDARPPPDRLSRPRHRRLRRPHRSENLHFFARSPA